MKKENKKFSLGIIVGFLSLLLLYIIFTTFISPIKSNFQQVQNEPENVGNSQNFEVNKILTSFEGENNVDLYIGEEGGPYSQESYVEVTNNNPQMACFKIYCGNQIILNDGMCSPKWEDDVTFCVEGNSKRIQTIRMSAFISPLTREGYYSGGINIELVKYFDDLSNDFIFKESVIKSYPLTINVYGNHNSN